MAVVRSPPLAQLAVVRSPVLAHRAVLRSRFLVDRSVLTMLLIRLLTRSVALGAIKVILLLTARVRRVGIKDWFEQVLVNRLLEILHFLMALATLLKNRLITAFRPWLLAATTPAFCSIPLLPSSLCIWSRDPVGISASPLVATKLSGLTVPIVDSGRTRVLPNNLVLVTKKFSIRPDRRLKTKLPMALKVPFALQVKTDPFRTLSFRSTVVFRSNPAHSNYGTVMGHSVLDLLTSGRCRLLTVGTKPAQFPHLRVFSLVTVMRIISRSKVRFPPECPFISSGTGNLRQQYRNAVYWWTGKGVGVD